MPYTYFTFSVWWVTNALAHYIESHCIDTLAYTDRYIHTGTYTHGDSNLHSHSDLYEPISAVKCSHIHTPFHRNIGLGRDTFTIHMDTHADTYTYKPNCMDPHAVRHSHECTELTFRHRQVLLTSSRSRPSPTLCSYAKGLKPTLLYKPCPPTHTHTHTHSIKISPGTYMHSTGILAHTGTSLRLTATHTEAGRHGEQCRLMHLHPQSH